MRYAIPCPCCGELLPVDPADVGRAVLCPLSATPVLVAADRLQTLPDPAPAAPPPLPRRRRGLLVGLLAGAAVLLLAGVLARPMFRDKPAADVAAGRAVELAPGDGAKPAVEVATKPAVEVGAAPTRQEPAAAATPAPDAPAPATPEPRPAEPPPTAPATAAPAVVPTARVPDDAPAPPVASDVGPAPVPAPAVAVPPVVGKLDPAADAGPAPVGAPAGVPLARRVDDRTESALLTELLAVREVSLDTPAAPQTSARLEELARAAASAGRPFAGPALAARGRADLAGLPFTGGPGAVLHRDPAEALDALSKKLRTTISACVVDPSADTRPDPGRLAAALLGDGPTGRATWAHAEAVPCVQQMLQAEGRNTRLVAVGALAANPDPAATAALAGWAAFDPDPGVRGAAARSLAGRDVSLVRGHLLGLLRHPWPRAAEHAAEALVELADRGAAPALAGLLDRPRPDAAFDPGLAGTAGSYRRELVRVNHARNCMMCHQASFAATDLVRSAVPDPARPLGANYAWGGSRFVRADTTYLRQDFSAVQPVVAPGPWPARQRYDYLVAVRPAKDAADPAGPDPYKAAALFALRELLARPDADACAFAPVADAAAVPADAAAGPAAQAAVQLATPAALAELWLAEFGGPLLSLSPAERTVALAWLRRTYGASPARLALVAYLDPLTRTGPAAARELAAKLMADARAGGVKPVGPADAPAVRALLAGDGKPAVRAAALRALADAGQLTPEAALALLADPAGEVRGAAAGALGAAPKHRQDVPLALAGRLRDGSAAVRLAAAEALAAHGLLPDRAGADVAAALFAAQAWDSDDQKAKFQAALVPVLLAVMRRAPDALPPVARAAGGDNPAGVPDGDVNQLLDASDGPAPGLAPLVGALARPVCRDAAARRLAGAGGSALDALVGGLGTDKPAAARAGCARLLGQLAARPAERGAWRAAQDALVKAKTADADPDVRAAATAALAAAGAGR